MSKKYFNALNYTIGNEDSALEYEILPENINHILAAAGSGSRIIPLIAKNPQYITWIEGYFSSENSLYTIKR